MFGGVPIGVPTPPMLAEYAIPNMSAAEKFAICFGSSSLPSSLTADTTANPIGSIIRVAAVLLIHMLNKALASMKPSTMVARLVPTRRTMCNAIRRCSPQRSMPNAMMKPPMNKKTLLLA